MNEARLKFLENLKADDLANEVPSISLTVAQFLHSQAHLKKAKSILEIGTAHAYSTIWLADVVQEFGGHLNTIDVSAPSFAIATQNLEACGLTEYVTQHFGNAKDIIPTIEQTFDLIFIDARKRDTHIFFALCAPKVNPGGVIIVDDVEKFKEKMQAFWDMINNQSKWEYVTLPMDDDDSIMLIQKK